MQPLYTTLPEMFAAARAECEVGVTLAPDDPKAPETHWSFAELFDTSTRMASSLRALGVRKGDRVLVLLPTSLEFLAAFAAIERLGAVPVPTYPPTSFRVETGLDRLCHVARQSGSTVCVTNKQLRMVLGELAFRSNSVRHIVTVEDLARGALTDVDSPVSSTDLALIQYTSGSTGAPKGVELSHAALLLNIHVIGEALGMRRDDKIVSWLPLYHDMGLIGTALFAVYWRVPLILMSPLAFLAKPLRWLEVISRHRATMATAPNFAYQLCTKRKRTADTSELDLSTWRIALNGAETVNHRTIREFVEAFEPHGLRSNLINPVYGLAEATLAVTFPTIGGGYRHETVDRNALIGERRAVPCEPSTNSMTLVAVGRAMPGLEVRIVDEEGNALGERSIGHVIVSGPSLMTGYYENAEATRAALRDGWLWTGDLGYFAGGELFITGREKDMIVSRGHNYYAEDIERVAEAVDGVRAGGAVAFGMYDEDNAKEGAVLVCETSRQEAEERVALADAVRTAVLESCGLRLEDVVVVDRGTLPKTSSGKKQRSACRRLHEQDQLRSQRLPARWRMALVLARSTMGLVMFGAKRRFSRSRDEAV